MEGAKKVPTCQQLSSARTMEGAHPRPLASLGCLPVAAAAGLLHFGACFLKVLIVLILVLRQVARRWIGWWHMAEVPSMVDLKPFGRASLLGDQWSLTMQALGRIFVQRPCSSS